MSMNEADLLSFSEKLADPRGASLARQIVEYLHRMTDVGIAASVEPSLLW